MRTFMDEEFLLTTETAKHLYHDFAEKMPIIDYHCHLSPKEIYEDVTYENITQLWLYGDHYKWRQMRTNGVEEKYITGDASDYEKFEKWAETLEVAIGNPLYHWSHLELKRYFGYNGVLKKDTAKEVWELCEKKLREGNLSARNLIRNSNVEVVCTTDDPADSLEWHEKIKADGFEVKVLPSFRPDRAMNLEKKDYVEYLRKLSLASGVEIDSFDRLIHALRVRLEHFKELGCKVADHGITYVMYEEATSEELEEIFKKSRAGLSVSQEEERKFKTAFLLEMAKAYSEEGLVMQLHYGVQRDLNTNIFLNCGVDAGIDAIYNYSSSKELAQFLDACVKKNALPKTIVYALNPIDNAAIDTVIGCFQDSSAVGKMQHGAAWWFNDHKSGMVEQMTSLANLGLLGNFVGMLTDSRSFLSYTRHEYFRRILCEFIGNMVENGEYPADENALKKIVEGISYRNAKRYFEF